MSNLRFVPYIGMCKPTLMNFDGQVSNRKRIEDLLPIEIDITRGRGDDRNDAAPTTRSELPHM